MLKGINSLVSPELIKILMEMGHGDEIVIADGNFPSASVGQRVVRLDGHGVPEVLAALLSLIPLDTYVEKPVALMMPVEKDAAEPEIWNRFREVAAKSGTAFNCELTERYAFYHRAEKAYAVIATGESAIYANIILKKGVVTDAMLPQE